MPDINTFQNPFTGLGQGGLVNQGGAVPNVGPAPDPLGKALEVYGDLNKQQMLKQQMELERQKMQQLMLDAEGEKRANAYFMDAYDPETNQVQQGKLIADLAADPLTAKFAVEYYKNAADTNKTNLEALNQALQAEKARTDGLGQMAAALAETAASEGRSIRKGEAVASIADAVSRGWITPEEGQKRTLNLPKEGPQLDAYVRQIAMEAELSGKAQERVWGVTRQYDTGGALVTDTTGLGGQITTQQVVPKTMTPNEAADIVTVTDPKTGRTLQYRKGDLANQGQAPGMGTQPGEAPLGPQPVGGSRTPREEQTEKIQIENDQKWAENAKTEGDMADQKLGILEIAGKNLEGLKTGGGGDYYKLLARIAAAAGTSSTIVNAIGMGDLSKAEVVDSLNSLIAVQQFKEITGQPNRDLANQEFNRMVGTGFSINNTPETNMKILKFYKGLQELISIRATALNAWEEQGRDVRDFRRAWNKQARKLLKAGILNGGEPLDDNPSERKGDKK